MSCDGDVTIARCGDSRHRVREAELSRVRVERTEESRRPQSADGLTCDGWMDGASPYSMATPIAMT